MDNNVLQPSPGANKSAFAYSQLDITTGWILHGFLTEAYSLFHYSIRTFENINKNAVPSECLGRRGQINLFSLCGADRYSAPGIYVWRTRQASGCHLQVLGPASAASPLPALSASSNLSLVSPCLKVEQ